MSVVSDVFLSLALLPTAFGQVSVTAPQRSSKGLTLAMSISYVWEPINDLHPLTTSGDIWKGTVSQNSAHGGGTSLKETLDWLRQQISMAGVEAVESESGERYSFAERFEVQHFDSCTVTIDKIVTRVPDGDPARRLVLKLRYTLPLGAIAGSSMGRTGNGLGDAYVSREKWGYRLFLTSEKKQISRVAFSSFETDVVEEMTDVFHVLFNSESTARRVLETFRYAADLCRDQEKPL